MGLSAFLLLGVLTMGFALAIAQSLHSDILYFKMGCMFD